MGAPLRVTMNEWPSSSCRMISPLSLRSSLCVISLAIRHQRSTPCDKGTFSGIASTHQRSGKAVSACENGEAPTFAKPTLIGYVQLVGGIETV